MKAILASIAVLLLSSASASAAPLSISCRAIGTVAEQGQTLCIQTPDGARLARCGMVLNVSSWTFLGQPCVPPPEPGAGEAEGAEGEPQPQP
jgi:hypothetical protein